MAITLTIHPENPQPRVVDKLANALTGGQVAIVPTDSGFSLVCMLEASAAIKRIQQIRQLKDGHFFTLLCQDISHASELAHLDKKALFKVLKSNTPGPCTFILPAGPKIPKKMLHKSRKTVGIRIPQSPLLQMLLQHWDTPLMSVSLFPYEESVTFFDPIDSYELEERFGNQVDIIVDIGECMQHVSTIVDCTDLPPSIARQGYGTAIL